jgi:hypothetical protein
MNQLVLGILLIIYSLWQIHLEMTGNGTTAALAGGDAESAGAMEPYIDMIHKSLIAVYLGLIGFAILGMGGLSFYYFSRRKYIEAYINETPAWIVAMQKSGMKL